MGSVSDYPADLEPGRAWPLGAHWDGEGVNFTLYSANAQRVELCLHVIEVGACPADQFRFQLGAYFGHQRQDGFRLPEPRHRLAEQRLADGLRPP